MHVKPLLTGWSLVRIRPRITANFPIDRSVFRFCRACVPVLTVDVRTLSITATASHLIRRLGVARSHAGVAGNHAISCSFQLAGGAPLPCLCVGRTVCRPAALHCSRNQLPNPAAVKGLPNCVVRNVR
jgi:hypothetical protein